MKKLIALLTLILLMLPFAACVNIKQTITIQPSSILSTSPSALPVLPEGYVPDVVQDAGSYIANSGCSLYEDKDYLIFKDHNGVYVYGKGKAQVLTVLPRCTAFTYYNSKVYYIGYDPESEKRYIAEYDPASGSEKKVREMDNMVVSMLAYNGRLYYSYLTDPENEAATELLSTDLSGKDLQSLNIFNVCVFCIDGDTIYYTKNNDFYSPVFAYNISTGDVKQIVEPGLNEDFEIKGGELFYYEHVQNKYVDYIQTIDLKTHKVTNSLQTYGDDPGYSLLGNYIVYKTQDNIDPNSNTGITCLYAYDLITGNKYKLLEPGVGWCDMYTSEYGAYLSPYNDNGSCQLYRVIISKGKAALEQVFNYTPQKTISRDTVIFANGAGTIFGGYSDGKWLTHSEAAAYCANNMKFSRYNLAKFTEEVSSDGIISEGTGGGYIGSSTYTMEPSTDDSNGFFSLIIPEIEFRAYDYSKDPLCYSYLYYGGTLPDIDILKNTSGVQRIIQHIVDNNLGKGKVKAHIRAAVEADIDGDGKKEIIVNADNNAEEFAYSGGDLYDEALEKYWFCLSCIIETDDSVVVIDDYYGKPYKEGEDYHGMSFFYVQNIIDIDSDGIYEIVLDWSAWETFFTKVYKYDGENLKSMMYFISGS